MASGYFIRGGSYLRWEVGGGGIDAGYPRSTSDGWSGLAGTGFEGGVDASLDLGTGKLYFFKGDTYLRIDNATNSVDGQVSAIAGNWPGMAEAGFADGLDAAINDGAGTAYFFRGGQYVTYDIAADRVSGGPASIADDWGGLADAGFADSVDAAVNWGTGVYYFFRGDQYVGYDAASDAVTEGPASTVAGWTGFGDVGFDQVEAAWVRLNAGAAPGPAAPASGTAGAGDCIWYFNGQVSKGPEIPRLTWFPTSTGATDYLGNGTSIFEYVVHSDGTILRGQPHMRSGRGASPGSTATPATSPPAAATTGSTRARPTGTTS